MFMCLQSCLNCSRAEARKRNRNICSWERWTHSRVQTAVEDATLTVAKKVLQIHGFIFLCVCYTNHKAAPSFLFPPLPKNNSGNQLCCSKTILRNSPLLSCIAAAGWTPALFKMVNTAATLWYFHLLHKNKSMVDLLSHTSKKTFLNAWICLDQMKRKAIDRKVNDNSSNNNNSNKNQFYLWNHIV